ncbi:hypothetical protein [Streptomyces sp. NPDC026673]|uniref:hypothetical protein n=1 Tax=Streptomyces sp. NPDC026673 TaxID=3155724 RepID=UPI0033CBB629
MGRTEPRRLRRARRGLPKLALRLLPAVAVVLVALVCVAVVPGTGATAPGARTAPTAGAGRLTGPLVVGVLFVAFGTVKLGVLRTAAAPSRRYAAKGRRRTGRSAPGQDEREEAPWPAG